MSREACTLDGSKRRSVAVVNSVPCRSDLVLLALLFNVVIPEAPPAPETAVDRALHHIETTLRAVFESDEKRAWSEWDSVAARAYVTSWMQLAPWRSTSVARTGKPEFDQMDTVEGWRLNLPAAMFARPTLPPTDRATQWRSRFGPDARANSTPASPLPQRGVCARAQDGRGGLQGTGEPGAGVQCADAHGADAFRGRFGAVESAASTSFGQLLKSELRI